MKTKIIILLVFLSSVAFGQEAKLGNWIAHFGNKKINDKWNFHYQIQDRNYNLLGDLHQLLVQTGFGYNLTEHNNNVFLGYGYLLTQNYIGATAEKKEVHEHRIFQQYITNQHAGRVGIQHRYRIEERFIDGNFKVRFRYFLSLNIPLNHSTMIDKTVYLSAYNEILLNAKDAAFDGDWLYGGIGYQINSAVRFELGYMDQFLLGANRDQLSVMSFVNF